MEREKREGELWAQHAALLKTILGLDSEPVGVAFVRDEQPVCLCRQDILIDREAVGDCA